MDEKLSVYVVEDDPFLAESIKAVLEEQEGISIEVFAEAESCLNRTRANPPQLMLLDVDLPGMNGFDLCREIRGDFELPSDIQIMFVSGFDKLESRLQGFDAGGNDYLVKPVEPDLLLRKVAQARKEIEQRRALAAQADFATKTAMTAMSSSGELGVVIEFMRKSFSCFTVERLIEELFNALRSYDFRGAVEVRSTMNGMRHSSSQGAPSELEVSILRAAADKGRIVEFKNRCIFNHGTFSLIVHNMPINEPERHGRFRDHLHMLVEAADARMGALEIEARENARARALLDAARDVRVSLSNIAADEAHASSVSMAVVSQLVNDLGKILLGLGLREADESYLLEYVEEMANNIRSAFADRTPVGPALQMVITQLERLAGATVDPK